MRFLNRLFTPFQTVNQRADSRALIIAATVVLILALFLVPLTPTVLDILLVLNLFIALALLLRAVLVADAAKLFAFPTVLLFTTLFRLTLNVSSTQLILLRGDQGTQAAGQVIEAFGRFVVGGDFVVGVIIFSIIAVVNFVVIARGSARVAEVAARFSLDSLPGKQLAIDADLRAGSISREEAQLRRDELARESKFFGSMDGAMRFVQGDAIAGLVITMINAVGGIAIGLSRGLELGEAVDTFGLLTVGDGLVSILPTLMISLCAGIVVTNASGSAPSAVGEQVWLQTLTEPRALKLGAGSLILIGLIPGFPWVFLVVGSALLLLLSLPRISHRFQVSSVSLPKATTTTAWLSDERQRYLPSFEGREVLEIDYGGGVEPLLIELGNGTVAEPLIREFTYGGRAEWIAERYRVKLFSRRGVLLPEISVAISDELRDGTFAINICGHRSLVSDIPIGRVLVSGFGGLLPVLGIRTASPVPHPVDGQPCFWMDAGDSTLRAARLLGLEVYDELEFIILSSLAASLGSLDSVFGLDQAMKMLDRLRNEHGKLVEEVFDQQLVSAIDFAELLRRLVAERVGIRDTRRIVEAIAQFCALRPRRDDDLEWFDEAYSFLRRKLAPVLLQEINESLGGLRAFVLSQGVEEVFRTAESSRESFWDGAFVEPGVARRIERSAKRMLKPALERGALPVMVLCDAHIRRDVQVFLSDRVLAAEALRTVSFNELDELLRPELVGALSFAQSQ